MVYYILKSYKLKTSPFNIFRKLSAQKYCFWLESSLNSNYSFGRYSFLGIDPFYIFQAKNRDPFADLRKICAQYKLDLPQTKLPFLGGAVGYFAYDLGFALEKKLNCQPKEDSGIPDCFFGFYNTIIIIDHFKQLLYIFSVGFPEKKYHLAKTLAETNFKKAYNLISQSHIDTYRPNTKENLHQISANFTKVNYLLAVKKAKEYIKAGDIYQVNLAQELQTKTDLSGPEIYGRLRKISPSYFSAYLDAKDFKIISSSPERFLKVEGNKVTTRPMKGTRPRSQNRLRDQRFKKALLKSAKDKAELIMIVDLERNDLGKVCAYDSIQVNKLRQLEGYSTVFQTTATVSGSLHKDKDRFDLLRACFPGGSITGCPKIRAMEIIEELEPTRRSIYTGSLGYLSFSGGLDFNILIRTILKKNNKLHFGIGGGIVADSRPEDEYRETLVKAKAMLEAIK